MSTSRSSRGPEFGDVAIESNEFGDRRKHGKRGKRHGNYPYGVSVFGNATKRKLKRPYKRSVVRKGRALIGKHKIGHVTAAKSEFKWVTRGGGVYAAKVKKGGGRRKAPKKRAKKHAKKK